MLHVRLILTVIFVALFFSINLVNAQQSYNEEEILKIINQKLLPAVVRLGCLDSTGEVSGYGSGVFSEEDGEYFVDTNAHVVLADDNEFYGCWVYFPRKDGSFYEYAYFAGEVVRYDKKESLIEGEFIKGIDYASVFITEAGLDENNKSLPFPPPIEGFYNVTRDVCKSEGRDIEIGDKIYVLGYPGIGGNSFTLTDGIISGFDYGNLDYDINTQFIKTTAPIYHGNSGGIVIGAKSGCLYGIPTWADSEEGGSIGRLLSFSFVNSFIEGITGKTIKLGCGDGYINAYELCEDEDLGGFLCEDFEGFTGGNLKCTDTCDLDFSQCQEEKELVSKIVPNCQEAGFNSCDIVLSPIIVFDEAVSNFGIMDFDFPYTEEWISCNDKTDITLAKYDYNNKIWVPISSKILEDEAGDKIIRAQIDTLETFAIIATEECALADSICRGYSLTPSTGLVRVGNNIKFNLCGIIPGCNPEKDNICSNKCTQGVDPDCGECTSNSGDCCLLIKDNLCDNDCGEFDLDCSVANLEKCSFTDGICNQECPKRDVSGIRWFSDPDCAPEYAKAFPDSDDGYCVNKCDGVCDKDCTIGSDPDCIKGLGVEIPYLGPAPVQATCSSKQFNNVCGNGICDEDITSCPQDCGSSGGDNTGEGQGI